MSSGELPELPTTVQLDERHQRVILSLPRRQRRLTLPLTMLPVAGPAVVRSLLRSRKPHVVFAPQISRRIKDLLQTRGWGWIDGVGNVRIATPEVYVQIDRKPSGQPLGASVRIPPQGERIVRLLLDSYPQTFRLGEVARLTELDKGYASRIVGRLARAGFVEYERNRLLSVPDASELFELWSVNPLGVAAYGGFADLPTEALARRIQLEGGSDDALAFTGVFAASLLAPHLEPERVEVYVRDVSWVDRLLRVVEGREVDRGANVHLFIHRDPGVISIGTRENRGLRLVSPSQIYRDALQRGRGREKEAAANLRRVALRW